MITSCADCRRFSPERVQRCRVSQVRSDEKDAKCERQALAPSSECVFSACLQGVGVFASSETRFLSLPRSTICGSAPYRVAPIKSQEPVTVNTRVLWRGSPVAEGFLQNPVWQ